MKYIRLFTGPDGESHFEDVQVQLKESESADWRSEFMLTKGMLFRETTGQYDLGFHNAPCRQFVITLEGQVDVIVGNGDQRRFGPGDIMLAEDVTGRGHISRAVDNKPRKCIFVTLE